MSRLQSFMALSLAALLVTVGSTVPAQAQGSHVAAAPMQSKRAIHTVTLLPSGQAVAIAGTDPFLSYEALATAEVYDPATNTWTLTGSLNQGRKEHSATALADGRILVTGGNDPTNVAYYPATFVLNSAEIYNPATGAFTSVGPMNEYRLAHQATLLNDGRVLITGGYNNAGLIFGSYGAYPPQLTATAEIYNPVTNTFTAISSMTTARAYHTATLLADGRVLIVGGQGAAAGTAEIFDPSTSTFSAIAAVPNAPRRVHGAVRLDDGRVLLAGGSGSAGTAEYFDPSTQSFVALPAMAGTFEFWGVIQKMTDGRVYLLRQNVAQLFNPDSNSFTLIGGSAGVGSLFSAGAALADGRVLVSGGQDFVPYTFVSRTAAAIFVPNDAPIADAGADQNVSPGAGCTAMVTLNGASSSDPDGDTLTFEWTQAGVVVGTSASVDVTLGLGTHTFTLTVSDGHGGSASDEVTIVVADTMAPSFAAPLPMPVTLEQEGPAGTFFAVATPAATDNCDASPVVTVSGILAGSIFPAGATDVTFSAADAAGNTASMTIAVTVLDTIAPVLSVPASIAVDATGPSGAAVSYAVSATDAVTPSPAVSCSPASGAMFAVGTTTVQCSSTDGAGNTGVASFQVTVADTTPPDITSVSADPGVLWAPNHKMVPVTVTVVANDLASATECRVSSVSSNQPEQGPGKNGSDWQITGDLTLNLRAERLGAGGARIYTIEVRCTDEVGNASTGASTVIVPHDQRR